MKYKQLLPIPDKYVVLLLCDDEYIDLEKEGWSIPFFVLTENAGESVVGVHVIDSLGEGYFEPDFRLALRQPAVPSIGNLRTTATTAGIPYNPNPENGSDVDSSIYK